MHVFFFLLLSFFSASNGFCQFVSVKLSRQQPVRARTQMLRITHTCENTCKFFCVLIGDGSDFVFSDWWQWEEGEEPLAHKDVFSLR